MITKLKYTRKQEADMELNIVNVTKKYPDKTAVNDVSLTLTPGIWGLLGANGAGKTTLMRMIADIIKPTSGEITLDGIDIHTLDSKYRDIFGYLPQEFGFYPEFSVRDYLEYISALKGLGKTETSKKIDELLVVLNLAEVEKKKIRKLSGGMKRRVGIAQALINEPKILILDEPTSGLDPGERIRFRNLISEFAKDRIVIISTHIVSDVEYISFKNVIMKEGCIISEGDTEELALNVDNKVFVATVDHSDLYEFENTTRVVNVRNIQDGQIEIRYLSDNNPYSFANPCSPRLEDYYLWVFPEEGGDK